MEQYHPLSTIKTALQQILASKQSGTFLLATDTNESARLGITLGRVHSCSFSRLHGNEAVQAIAEIQSARYSLSENFTFPFRERDATSHDFVLATLQLSLPENTVDARELVAQEEPRGAVLPEDVVQAPAKVYRGNVMEQKTVATRKKVYRGKIIEVPVEEAEVSTPKRKKVVMYRGRPLD